MLERLRLDGKVAVITGGGTGLGRVEEVGPLAVSLASEASDMMTGQTLWRAGAAMSRS